MGIKRQVILASLAAALIFILPADVRGKNFDPDIRPGKGCTENRMVSDYFPPLKGSNLDTRVYFLDSKKPGATVLVIGGTHANEPAGTVAAQVLVESARVDEGRLIVIPHANSSAASIKDTRCNIPYRHELTSKSGTRYMTYGDRRTDPDDHNWLDREKKALNLNRVWPGDPKDPPTSQLAHAIFTLIQKEKVDFFMDLHEARTQGKGQDRDKYRLANSLVAHPSGLEIGAFALLDMEEDTGISLKLEASSEKHKGLSHWEIGSRTSCIPFLTESPNPGQDCWRENPDVINDPAMSLKHRVGIHLRMLIHLGTSYADATGKPFKVRGIPEYKTLMEKGIGPFLN